MEAPAPERAALSGAARIAAREESLRADPPGEWAPAPCSMRNGLLQTHGAEGVVQERMQQALENAVPLPRRLFEAALRLGLAIPAPLQQQQSVMFYVFDEA